MEFKETLEQFKKLFQGTDSYFGKSKPLGQKNSRGKEEYKHWTEKVSITDKDWLDHLEGKSYTGIIPIRDDSTCSWGVIDVDRYNINHKQFIKLIRDRKYPFIPYRSKSNGLHLILHLSHKVPAKDMRKKLIMIASDLGVNDKTTDIFPAQDKVDLTDPDWEKKQLGQFVNLPYQNAKFPTRCAMDDEGNSLQYKDYLTYAKKFVITKEHFYDLKTSNDDENKEWPNCVNKFVKNQVQEGEGRNDAMFNVGILAKKINPDKDYYEEMIRDLNKKICAPPLNPKELNKVMEQVGKHDYSYKCGTSIARSFCNGSRQCAKRKFGIGINEAMPEVGKLIKVNTYPDPYWLLPIQGKMVRLETKQLYQQQLLGEKLLAHDIIWRPLKPSKRDPDPYRDWLEDLVTNKKDMEDVDREDERKEIFNIRMVKFLEDTNVVDEFDQIDHDNIWHDDEEVRFKLDTFRLFMKKQGYNWSEKDCTMYLKENDCGQSKKFQGNNTRHWVSSLPKQTEHKNKNVKFNKKKTPWEDN
tara:strand:+ start:446 stop:2017 length:1572 start_codon:yes stop_codon:yes gene_type:complete